MYLDPEPRANLSSTNLSSPTSPTSPRVRRDNSSGFFSSQRPIVSPRDLRKTSHLQERRKSQPKIEGPIFSIPKTVRLVEPSPSPWQSAEHLPSLPATTNDAGVNTIGDAEREDQTPTPQSHPGLAHPARLRLRDSFVSGSSSWTNDTPILEYGSNTTLSVNDSLNDLPIAKLYRRSASPYSQSSTIQDGEIGIRKGSGKSSDRSSQGTTLRETTPDLWDAQGQHHSQAEGLATPRSKPARALQTLQEVSPEKPATVRGVPPSETSASSAIETRRQGSDPSVNSSPDSRVQHSDEGNWEQISSSEGSWGRASSRRAKSVASVRLRPGINDLRSVAASVSPYSSSQDLQHSESSQISLEDGKVSHSSSPNFVAFGPGSIREIIPGESKTSTSNESFEQSPLRRRSGTGPTLASTSSSASLGSNFVLPPLYIPRRRPHGSAPVASILAEMGLSTGEDSMEDMEEIDTLPYPKRPFSSHLSTIASMSEHQHSPRQSHRTNSQTLSRMSYFSMGSGVLTGDDMSVSDRRSIPLYSEPRRRSEPGDSVAYSIPETFRDASFDVDSRNSADGTYRTASAIPQPLFRAGQPTVLNASKKYDGPMPPLPPIPLDLNDDEDFDQLSALPSTPSLHAKKSGHSLRHQRSKSTPGHSRHTSQVSYVGTESRNSMSSHRNSTGSVIFPIWAKRFYSGTYALPSRPSLNNLAGAAERDGPVRGHERTESSWTDRSITSRLGTGYSNMESISPTSSRIMPAMFRARTRKLIQAGGNKITKPRKKRMGGNRSGDTTRTRDTDRDSMAITTVDSRPHAGNDPSMEYLPSGQPKYGVLKDSSPEPGKRRLPRKYSKQRLWDTMEFPRPMTSDRFSDLGVPQDPRLGPPTRASQRNLPKWYAPSFVESLDGLVRSRCNRQILLFTVGFVFPLAWMLGAVLPLPHRPIDPRDLPDGASGSHVDVATAMMKHEAGADSELRWREERTFLKARWWRMLNRVMSAVGLLVIGAIIALVVITV